MAEFIKHTNCNECGSKDNLAVYSDGSCHCFGCGYTEMSDDYREYLDFKSPKQKQVPKVKKMETNQTQEQAKPMKPVISPEDQAQIKQDTVVSVGGYRSIRDDITKQFGVRYKVNDEDDIVEQYYPVTYEGSLSGYKIRELPKNFHSKGRVGVECELFGQFKFNRGGKYVLIQEGELDALSAYQMFSDYNKSKGSEFEIAVVSPTTGAKCSKQIANNFKFFDSFDQIIVGFDNDKVGKESAEEVVKYLPKGKVKIMQMRYKDANEYLKQGKQKEFISDFYNAKQYVPVGVVASNQISEAMRNELKVPKIPLPPFMYKLQDMMAGGIPLGRAVNLGSASGTGKSTIIDEIIYFLIFNSPHKCGIVTLESTVGQYGIKLLSRHISKKLELLGNEVALDLIDSELVKEKEYELFNNKDGSPRFYLVDDRDSGATNIQEAVENIVISCGCKVIVLDPLHDIIAALPLDEQENFMSWQKGLMKSHNVTFLNVAHTRKTSGGQKAGSTGADLHEEDIMGNSAIYKSAACNLMFTRNKEAEDEMERNTTIMKATKIRWTGKTGVAGKYYYDNEQHRLYDLDDYMNGVVA